VAVGSLVLTLLCYGTFFGLAFVIASLHGALRAKSRGGTPFATVEPPPQIIPPEEPE
jgi:hypothetical protein